MKIEENRTRFRKLIFLPLLTDHFCTFRWKPLNNFNCQSIKKLFEWCSSIQKRNEFAKLHHNRNLDSIWNNNRSTSLNELRSTHMIKAMERKSLTHSFKQSSYISHMRTLINTASNNEINTQIVSKITVSCSILMHTMSKMCHRWWDNNSHTQNIILS